MVVKHLNTAHHQLHTMLLDISHGFYVNLLKKLADYEY